MEAETLRSSPAVRFLGGLGAMILVSLLGTVAFGFAITWIWPPDIASPEFGLQRVPLAFMAANVLGMAGLAWLASSRRDGMFLLGGLAVVALEAALAVWLVGRGFN